MPGWGLTRSVVLTMVGPLQNRLMLKITVFYLLFFVVSCASVRARYHTVSAGETMGQIAERYAIPVGSLARANGSVAPSRMSPGTRLYVPFEAMPGWNSDYALVERELTTPEGAFASRDPSTTRFSWPVAGAISSHFGRRGRRMHEGIDIVANRGTPVGAARSGHVIYSGNGIRGYGNLVIVRHIDGYTSVYAHLSRISVRKGQYVNKGQLVGAVGNTGRTTGHHLHFEIRSQRVAVNPLLHLQSRVAANKVGR